MAEGLGRRDAADGVSKLRHWLGFLVSGVLAFAVDGLAMEIAVRLLGMPPLGARLVSIMVAMVVAWTAHRNLTFALTVKPSFREFGRYFVAASTTAAINYTLFALQIVIRPDMPRLAALFSASIVATIFSYLSMRYGVFRRSEA